MNHPKYRAWYPTLGKMYEDIRVGGFEGDTVPSVWWTEREEAKWVSIWGDNKDGHVMQYSDCTDRDNVRICEGDIADSCYGIGYVYKDDRGFMFDFGLDSDDLWRMSPDQDFVILGDIYRHKHLLGNPNIR